MAVSAAKHTPGPWENREGTILADTREQSCCGRPCVGAEYMGQQEMVCCGNPEVDGDAEDPIATVKYERDIPLVIAAPDMLKTLQDMDGWLANTGHAKDHPWRLSVRAAIAKATGSA
jgi:hypothetical protein